MNLFAAGWDTFQQGGWVMWPILGCSLIALTIIFERLFYFARIQTNPGELMARVRRALDAGKPDEAVGYCRAASTPVASIVLAALQQRDGERVSIEEAIEEAGFTETPKVEKYLIVLGVIAKVATLLGLYGTVLGMIQSFNVIASAGLAGDPGGVARGIAIALITTAGGLSVSIPTVIFYHYFQGRAQRMIYEMERVGMEITALLTRGRGNC